MKGPRSKATACDAGIAIEGIVFEAMLRFARVLARTGVSTEQMARAFAKACEQVPQRLVTQARRHTREVIDASHVLTVWYSDPMYLDANGEPIRLRARGEAPSLEALIKRVDVSLDLAEVIRYLARARTIQRSGSGYVPRSRAVLLRGAGGAGNFLGLRTLVGVLRNVEHNSQPKHRARRWFQRFAENPHFPVRARVELDNKLERLGTDILNSLDADMQRAESARRPGEPTVRMGIGIYRFEDQPEPDQRGLLRKARRRSVRRKR
jgi:hypothetical protein